MEGRTPLLPPPGPSAAAVSGSQATELAAGFAPVKTATGKHKGFAPVKTSIPATRKDKEQSFATLNVNLCNVLRSVVGGGAFPVPGGDQGGGGQVLECRCH